MPWQQEWELISQRIEGLVEMAQVYSAALVSRGYREDLPETTAEIYRSADDVYTRLIHFREHDAQIPDPARYRLIELNNDLFRRFPSSRQRDFKTTYDQTLAFVISLAAFRSEFSALLADAEVAARSIVDRAFLHLQRSIVADDSFGERWRKAFSSGEAACEKLGAIHLLSSGIYAFKAHSAGERTDLVLGDSVNLSEATRATDLMALTEWKKVDGADDLTKKAEQAFNQARIYGSSSLAGFELRSRRYLVMVSEKRLKMPDDRPEGVVTYEFRNIAIAPDIPSHGA